MLLEQLTSIRAAHLAQAGVEACVVVGALSVPSAAGFLTQLFQRSSAGYTRTDSIDPALKARFLRTWVRIAQN
jgi:hypothetical protein